MSTTFLCWTTTGQAESGASGFGLLKRHCSILASFTAVGDPTDAGIHAYTRAVHPDDYLSILGFADADHASDKNNRKSQTGYVFLINNGAVVWDSHKQHSVALSTREAEYMALSDASREAVARTHLYSDLQITTDQPPLLYSDSTTALLLTDESSPY
jgi:hypothetical protein